VLGRAWSVSVGGVCECGMIEVVAVPLGITGSRAFGILLRSGGLTFRIERVDLFGLSWAELEQGARVVPRRAGEVSDHARPGILDS